jgi:hypothetical protein
MIQDVISFEAQFALIRSVIVILFSRVTSRMGALPSEPVPSSVVALTKLLQSELGRLSREDEALRQLRRSFHLLLHELQEEGRHATKDLSTEPPMSAGRQPVKRLVNENDRMTKTRHRGKASISGERLRRACRIAVMETDQAASAEDIRSRILRRGSFPFKNLEYAAVAIVQTMDMMAEEGEVFSLDDGPHRHWRRTGGEERPTTQ